MRPPTSNPITQTKHGAYNAVDYGYIPDPIFYAPEDVIFHVYLPNAGDAGNNLQVNGSSGRHGFCHLEESYMQPGQTIRKGQPLGKMGYTGLTIPTGPAGRHLHWVILRNGVYIYPPDYITESFQEEDMTITNRAEADAYYQLAFGRLATDAEAKDIIGRTFLQAVTLTIQASPYKDERAKVRFYDTDVQQLATKVKLLEDSTDPKIVELAKAIKNLVKE